MKKVKQKITSLKFKRQDKVFHIILTDTVWCNKMGTIFAEMSSCTALTRHLGMKTTTYLFLILLVLNIVFIPVWHVKAVEDDISAKPVHIWLHHIVRTQSHVSKVRIRIVTLKNEPEAPVDDKLFFTAYRVVCPKFGHPPVQSSKIYLQAKFFVR